MLVAPPCAAPGNPLEGQSHCSPTPAPLAASCPCAPLKNDFGLCRQGASQVGGLTGLLLWLGPGWGEASDLWMGSDSEGPQA